MLYGLHIIYTCSDLEIIECGQDDLEDVSLFSFLLMIYIRRGNS